MNLKKPTSIEEAKEYAISYTSRPLTKSEVEERLRDYHAVLETETSPDLIASYKKQIESYTALLKNNDFIERNHHQGIDDLLLDLIEWRSLYYAFQSVGASSAIFERHVFLQQWMIGGVYVMYSHLSKLISRDNQDKSLRKLWLDIYPFIEQDLNSSEAAYINEQLKKDSNRFSNSTSKAIAFRNKVIAHNEKNIDANLNHLDIDIQLVARIWAFVTTWSSLGIINQWRNGEAVFSALKNFYSAEELEKLKKARREYLNISERWFKTNLLTQIVEERSPFVSFSVTIRSAK